MSYPRSWQIIDGRREPVALVDFNEYQNPETGELRWEKLPEEWHVWQACERDPEWQRRELELCRRDPWRWLTTWCWTFDQQDPENPVKRFPEYKFLYDLVQEWLIGGDTMTEKPRASVTTILYSYLFLHGMQFDDGFTGFLMSFTLPRVDDGGEKSTYDSIIGKMRFCWQLQKPWMKAPLDFRYRHVTHRKDRTRFISAEAASGKTGRGLQTRRAFLDEIGWSANSEAIVAAADRACPTGKIFNGTPHGRTNAMYRIREEVKRGKNKKVRLVELRWYHHPLRRQCQVCGSTRMTATGGTLHKTLDELPLEARPVMAADIEKRAGILEDFKRPCQPEDGLHWDGENGRWSSPWYEDARATLTDSMAAQELDVSYEESIEGRVYPIFRRRVFLSPRAYFKIGLQHVWAWDFGVDDFTACLMGQHHGGAGEIYDTYERNGVGVEHYCTMVAWLTGQFHVRVHKAPDGMPFCVPEETWLPLDTAKKYARLWGPGGRYAGVKILHVGDPHETGRESDLLSWYSRFALGTAVEPSRDQLEHLAALGIVSEPRSFEPVKVGQVYMNPAPNYPFAEGLQTVTWAVEHGRLRGLDAKSTSPNMGADKLANAFEQYHRPTDQSGRIVVNRKPVHDESSHKMDAIRYWSLYVFGLHSSFIAAGRGWERDRAREQSRASVPRGT